MRDPTLEELFARRGAITRIATELGISTAAVSQWRRVPDERVADVARILGVAPEVLRPDLTEPPPPKPEGPVRMATRTALRRRRRTKVIATLGPASSTIEVIERLYRAGADVFAARSLPSADKTPYALMFDKALAATALLDGAASDGRMRLKIERGLDAMELAELILVGGSAPMVRQVEAKFG